MLLSNAGSCSKADDVGVESSYLWRFYFRPSTMTVSRIHGMVNGGYFADGMGCEPGQETVPEPNVDEAVLFEDASTPCAFFYFVEVSNTNSLA
jgi:hypothetical protein